MAAIGRAVVVHLMGADNEIAARQATPERVTEWIRRIEAEKRALECCDALRAGRYLLALRDVVAPKRGDEGNG